MTNLSNSDLFSQILKNTIDSYCLHNFPCGKGSWNSSDNSNENAPITKEDLLELINSKNSPWNFDSSIEISNIRQTIILKNIAPSYAKLRKMFKTLRLTDKNILEVGEEIKLFQNLEELFLSANYIRDINSKNLPTNLKILELYANLLNSINFCSSKLMPRLEHLGVGANRLSDISVLANCNLKYTLVSLDLSKNKLANLSETLNSLIQISSLKNLMLIGNPLSLLAVYRAYSVDSLKSLIVLDDIPITADERFSVKGMRNISETVRQLCKFKISINSVNNMPLKELPENAPEEPIIKTDYFIKFWFPFQSPTKIINENEVKVESELDNDIPTNDEILYLHTSEKLPRNSPEILFNFTEDFEINNISQFCNFLNEKLKIEIMEESKYLYSPENLPTTSLSSVNSANNKKRQKSATKDISDNSKESKDKKKKKINESKMVVHSSVDQKLAEYLVDISCFIDGAINIDQVIKSDFELKSDLKTNEVSKKMHEKDLKAKGTSSKGEQNKKVVEKSNSPKDGKPQQMTTDQPKQIECHIQLNLLTLSNPQ